MEGEEYICSTDDEAIAPLMPNRHARSPDPHHDDQQPESPSVKRPPSRPVADRLRVEENDTISSSGAEKHEEAQALLFTGRRRFRSRPHPLDPSPPPPPLPAASRGYQSPSSSEYAPVSPPSPPANVLSVPSSSLRSATVAGGRSLDRARARDGRAQQSTVVTPSVAAGAVSARLVSASGPVASGAARWRQAAVAAFSRNRTSMLPGVGRVASFGRRNGRSEAGAGGGAGAGTGAGAVSGGRTGVNANTVAVNRHHRLRNRGSRAEVGQSGETQGLPSRGSRTHREEGGGDDEEGYGEDVGEGGGAGQESSSSATSETEADAADAAVVDTTPPEVRQVLESSQNTIALLLLVLSHYIITHIIGIIIFVLGTAVLLGLDRRLHSHADARVLKSRFVLIGVAATSVIAVAGSAFTFNKFPEGEGLLRGLILGSPKPDLSTVAAVIRTTVVVDLWARLLSVAIKALLAILAARDNGNNSNNNNNNHNQRPCLLGGLVTCNRCHHCRRHVEVLRRSGSAEGRPRLRESPRAAVAGTDNRGRGNAGFPGGAHRMCRAWRNICFCFSERFCGAPYRFGGWLTRPGAGSGLRRAVGDEGGEAGQGAEGGREANGGTAVLISRAGRQRRMYAVVEMAFLLYRSLLPVPAWLQFYSKDSEYFAAVYLVLKGMEVSFRADRLARAVCYVRRGDLERGVFATPEEVAEAGSPDCSICYERMERPLLLPCQHLFCGECVAEWLERERTCPLCRAEVPTSNPIPKSVREGRTAVVPQIL